MGIYNTILALTYSALELCLSLTNQQSKAKFIIIFFNSTYRKPIRDKGSVLANRNLMKSIYSNGLYLVQSGRPWFIQRKKDQWEVTLCRLTPNPISQGQLNRSHKKSCLLQDLISLSQLIGKVGLIVKLLNQERISPKFLSGDVTYKSIPIPWLIFITDEWLPLICPICLENVVKLLKLSQARGFLLGQKKSNPLNIRFN